MNTIQAVDRALRLLQEVAARGDWVGVRELARATELKVPTAQNLLKTLQAKGFLEFDERTRGYRIGLAALRLAEAGDSLARLADFCRPQMEALYQRFGETVVAMTWSQGRAQVVHWLQSEHPLAVVHSQRVIDHPHLMATGLVLLAYQSPEAQRSYAEGEPLAGPGEYTPATVEELLGLLDKVRGQGYAQTENAQGTGITAVAAPVVDARGGLVLAIGCSAPTIRLDENRLQQIREAVLEAAGKMTDKLTHGDRGDPGSDRRPTS